jgi:DNA-binding transcriptional ArsR family regulator
MTRRDDHVLWRALVDPTRRRILDLLLLLPRTTGELAGRFDMTRFAVMKHLAVLVDAGLVLVERRGRERLNHLNPEPIQEISRRWMTPFAQQRLSQLRRLKRHIAQTERRRSLFRTGTGP